jgi:hypothetical protein
MREQLILSVLTGLYGTVLRGLLVSAVRSTDNEWDDRIVTVVDALLGYSTSPIGGREHHAG